MDSNYKWSDRFYEILQVAEENRKELLSNIKTKGLCYSEVLKEITNDDFISVLKEVLPNRLQAQYMAAVKYWKDNLIPKKGKS